MLAHDEGEVIRRNQAMEEDAALVTREQYIEMLIDGLIVL